MSRLAFAPDSSGRWRAAGDGYSYERLTKLEAETLAAIDRAGLWLPDAAHFRYVEGRRFEADFAWLARSGELSGVLLECQGGIYTRRAHGSVTGVLADIGRGNRAAAGGWLMLRNSRVDLESDETWAAFVEHLSAALVWIDIGETI